jgi:hypothetical protein
VATRNVSGDSVIPPGVLRGALHRLHADMFCDLCVGDSTGCIAVASEYRKCVAQRSFFWRGNNSGLLSSVYRSAFSYVKGRVGRLVYEQYGRMLGQRAQSAERFLRRSWWLGVSLCLVTAVAGGWGLYLLLEPAFTDLRQQRVITKSDLDALKQLSSSDLQNLSDRIGSIERGHHATIEDLEKLRREFDQKIITIKPANQ